LACFQSCEGSSTRNDEADLEKLEIERLDLAYKICSLETRKIQNSGEGIYARIDSVSQDELDLIIGEGDWIQRNIHKFSDEFEELIYYSNHDTPFTSKEYAQYYYATNFYKKSDKFIQLIGQDSLFENLEPKSRKSMHVERIDSVGQYFFVNSATKTIAEKLNLDWDSLSRADKNELNSLVEAKIMVANYDFFPSTSQNQPNNCGAACLKMICDYYGNFMSLEDMDSITKTDETGASFNDLYRASPALNLKAERLEMNYDELLDLDQFPLIANWNDNHFVVVYDANDSLVWVADPALGLCNYGRTDFCYKWMFSGGFKREHGRAMSFVPLENDN
jgi:ATP-binding cassette subfamily B protein